MRNLAVEIDYRRSQEHLIAIDRAEVTK